MRGVRGGGKEKERERWTLLLVLLLLLLLARLRVAIGGNPGARCWMESAGGRIRAGLGISSYLAHRAKSRLSTVMVSKQTSK